MTDFSFTNKAYDLLQSLKEEGIIHKPRYNSIGEVRLAIDLVKFIYPLYSASDDNTMSDFLQDLFKITPTKMELTNANHTEEHWRPVMIQEILPGVTLKIIDDTCSYFTTFWTYDDTKRIIPVEETELRAYSNAFMSIWEKAKKGKVFIKNTFEHRIGDKVKHMNDPNSIGTIMSRRMTEEYKNEYAVFWSYCTEVIFKPWDLEYKLINQTKLEAPPMKTIIKKGKPRQVTRKIFDQDLYDNLVRFYRYSPDEIKRREIGWIEETVQFKPPKRTTAKRRELAKQRRKANHAKNLATYKSRVEPDAHIKLVCVKHLPTEVVSRIKKSEAETLVDRENGNYQYATKLEWRQYLNKRLKNFKELNPPKHIPMGTESVLNPKTGEKEIIPMIRKYRRTHKNTKGSRLVKEQFVTKIIPEKSELVKIDDEGTVMKILRPAHTIVKRILTRIAPHKEIKVTEEIKSQRLEQSVNDRNKYLAKKGLVSLEELKEEFSANERRNDRFSTIEKWSTTFDTLFTMATTAMGEVSKNVIRQLKRPAINILATSLIREEHKFQWDDSKIARFFRYLRLTNRRIFESKPEKVKKVKQPVEFEVVKTITRVDYSKLKQNLPKENEVISIKYNTGEGEVEKHATFKEMNMYTATGDLLCSVRDVISWKAKKDKEYQDLIIDEGGGIRQVPIKFRRKDPDHLKKYFERQKSKKIKNGIKKTTAQKV